MAREPFYLASLANISPKPNILRAGLPVAVGAVVGGSPAIAGPSPQWFAAEPLINQGTRACYHFSDPYCYSAGANPPLSTAVANDLASTVNVMSTGAGPMTYANGGFVFTATNATDGTAAPASQGILFETDDLLPSAEATNHFVSTIWIDFPTAIPANTVNSLIFTYADGSTWSLVAGVLAFTPVGQTAISVPTGSFTGGLTHDVPVQLGYSIDAATDGTSQYSVSVYTNGQKVSTTNYATAYAAGHPDFVGFNPNATAAADLASYIALRLYVENTTVSSNNPAIVVATDYLINNVDLQSAINTGTLPEIAAPPAGPSEPAPAPAPVAPAPTPATDGTVANFTSAIQPNGLEVIFTDTSVPASGKTITAWSWNYGDGAPAGTTQNPTHTYTANGTYLVTLTITDSNSQTATSDVYITVAAQVTPPVNAADGTKAAFDMSIDGKTVAFTDKSVPGTSYTISSWSWNFGDNTALVTTQNPTHTYTTAGNYVIALTVTDSNSQTATITQSVNVY